ncbi:carboxylate-amine ligase [Actinoplanes siamensis]|uniref:Putative glutamate--cysteine ligase 2 n=1 Tax=Actinoplanes siamensis TaxID=1223317 RepID=A0A919N9P9_9ACTN|nr:glutamate--cysteine ligase [Actinoplanes siamensis]GIF06809.1 putative glutamate--cysteine ligase 2 [Actinoplanes siamensis]
MTDDFTIGVEEEYHLVGTDTFALCGDAEMVEAARAVPGVDAEIGTAQLEVATPVCTGLAGIRSHLVGLRVAASAAIGRNGCRLLAAGTHPFGSWRQQRMTPRPRYVALLERWGVLALQLNISGCHVHVGVPDPDLRAAVSDHCRPWLPALLALTASSPFWEGVDTGYASYRSQWYARWPIAGPPPVLGDDAGFRRHVERLLSVGVIDDASHLYWDVRPSVRYPALEFRVADVCPLVDDAILHAGLVRGLVRTMAGRAASGTPAPDLPDEVARAARWRAARYGLDECLWHPLSGILRPAAEVVGALLDTVAADLREHCEYDELAALLATTLQRGTSASRQRMTMFTSGDLTEVARVVAEETTWHVAPAGRT